jgi:pyridoxine 5-phosphate synthase
MWSGGGRVGSHGAGGWRGRGLPLGEGLWATGGGCGAVGGHGLLHWRMIHLGVNIDHVATLRQARYRGGGGRAGDGGEGAGRVGRSSGGVGGGRSPGEPDPVLAALEAEVGGADIITVHLREDRRHIQDRDLEILLRTVRVKINLEMAATEEMVGIAGVHRPHMVTLVPEGREEVTTEGGLDVRSQSGRLKEVVKRLRGAGIEVSAFIDAELPQVEAAHAAGFSTCEVHTGPYAQEFARSGGNVRDTALGAELGRVAVAGGSITAEGMRFNAGHALSYHNVARIAGLPGISELHIGHAIVSRAVAVGMREAVKQMKQIIHRAHLSGGR